MLVDWAASPCSVVAELPEALFVVAVVLQSYQMLVALAGLLVVAWILVGWAASPCFVAELVRNHQNYFVVVAAAVVVAAPVVQQSFQIPVLVGWLA